jgi:cytochrome c biogenesis factor
MDKPLDNIRASTARTTPKDFFLWAGAMVTLYGSIIAFINLLFGYINYTFPDALNTYYQNPYDSGISYWMAAFIILAAAAIGLLRTIHKTIEHDATRADIWVRRWALYLTLFIAGITILGDLIALLNAFLAGEDLTARFLLKVLVVLLVASGTFMHFLADLRGYWAAERKRANAVTAAVALVGICAIAAGFLIIGTPWHAREIRLDSQRVSDLQQIQSQIVNYWQQKARLPKVLSDLNDSLSYFTVPADPTTRQPYEYQTAGVTSFKLCATFTAEGTMDSTYATRAVMPADPYGKGTVDNWSHGAGRVCFERTIDPELYPPVKK